MILYHGSYLEIPNPDLKHSRANVDFGLGFYTTPLNRLKSGVINLNAEIKTDLSPAIPLTKLLTII